MTCSQCRHEFCWICLGDWSEHGSATGGYYQCNLYEEKKKQDGAFAALESERQNAENDMARYLWHFERYNNHERSGRLAKGPQIKTRV